MKSPESSDTDASFDNLQLNKQVSKEFNKSYQLSNNPLGIGKNAIRETRGSAKLEQPDISIKEESKSSRRESQSSETIWSKEPSSSLSQSKFDKNLSGGKNSSKKEQKGKKCILKSIQEQSP